jgi:branched-chain amino acid transport system ATP-binding protein
MLRLRNIEAGYGKLRVLKGVSMHVSAGEIVTIIGGNGAGKSTLLSAVAGLVPPTGGSILIDGREMAGAAAEAIVALGCSLVPEGRQLFPSMTVRENLVLGGYLRGRPGGRSRGADPASGPQAGLPEVARLFPRLQERQGQLAGTLSGGEQQMLAIARSLMSAPRLIMLDEPSMGLAPLVVRDIMRVIRRLRDDGRTVLLVEQNARAALAIADRGYVMETGSIVLEGSAEELLQNLDVQRAYLGKEYRSVGE